MITGQFARRFINWFGSPLPRNYISWDMETTGFERHWDFPLQIGHVLVADGKIVTRREYILQWTRSEFVDQRWLRNQLEYLKDRIEHDHKLGGKSGRIWQLDYDRIDREGKDPLKVLTYYRDLFRKCRKNKYMSIGQQGWYDATMFGDVSHEFLEGDGFDFDDDELFDVGSLVKSIQCEPPMMPKPEETLKKWARRVNATPKPGVRWTIKHSVELFGLKEDAAFDPSLLHGAGEDAYWVHRIFEELRCHVNKALAEPESIELQQELPTPRKGRAAR